MKSWLILTCVGLAGLISTPARAQATAAESPYVYLSSDPGVFSLVGDRKGLSLHEPMYLLPATYSEEYHGNKSEMIFALSLKLRPISSVPFYLAYSQKTFLDWFDSSDSKPVRATDYNPQAFYRFIPADRARWHNLGADIGFEHESNGKALPDSRSWNRVYVAPFQLGSNHLIYWQWWFRLPEDKSKPPTDPSRDDNPDIQAYYGYSELHLEQRLFGGHQADLMLRYNPESGRGAANLTYSIPNHKAHPSFYWTLYLWQGYGESISDYNHSITRIGLGFSLAP